MKIGMITQWYEPERGAAAHPTAIAEALQARGHDLRVLTGFPSYPTGRVHSGYRMRLSQTETRNGIELLRVPDVPSHDQNALRRALTLTSFAASATVRVGWLRDCDVVLTYLSPATVGFASWALQRLAGVPYVLYVQDLWPETVTASGFIAHERANAAVESGIHRALRGLYARAAGVVAISPTMAATLADRGAVGVPESIPNWVDESIFSPTQPASEPDLRDGMTWLMYAGGMGEVQALEHSVEAITLLSSRPDIALAFVGDGVARPGLEALVRERGVSDRVVFLGSRSMEDMPGLMARAAAQIVSLRDLPLFRGTIPSKIQAAMACAAPVVCAVAGDAASVVTEADCGIVVEPESAMALAEAFVRIADLSHRERAQMGERGRAAYEKWYSARAGAAKLEAMLERAAETRR